MNRKIWGTRLILRTSKELCRFCFDTRYKLDHKGKARRSYKTHNSVLLSSLSYSVCRHKGNVLLLRNVTWYSLPVASACYLLNQTYILNANLKFPPHQQTNTSKAIQIIIIHYKFQNSKHKPYFNKLFSLSMHNKPMDWNNQRILINLTPFVWDTNYNSDTVWINNVPCLNNLKEGLFCI